MLVLFGRAALKRDIGTASSASGTLPYRVHLGLGLLRLKCTKQWKRFTTDKVGIYAYPPQLSLNPHDFLSAPYKLIRKISLKRCLDCMYSMSV